MRDAVTSAGSATVLIMRVCLFALPVLLSCGLAISATCQQLTPTERAKLDTAIQQVVTTTKVPSASIGVSRDGKVVYAQAFGDAVLPRNVGKAETLEGKLAISAMTMKAVTADAAMAYPVGSISKQFTATCILLLQERGKLRLDDPVARWFPNFTRANDITVRNLLTHTSGYSDYAPQDYTIPAWTRPVTPLDLVTTWATKPLDFEPGTRWQYSNTNFELAALIVERASGQRFHDFLWQNVITPLELQGVIDLDVDRDRLQVRGYEQHALGPMRPAILEAPGWYFGDAQLAMPVSTLLAWDESIVHRTLLQPASYDAMEAEFKLKDGTGSGYGLGVFVQTFPEGKVVLHHSGEVGGFVSKNVVSLSDDICYAALTNEEAGVAGLLTRAMKPILLPWTVSEKKPPLTIQQVKATGNPSAETLRAQTQATAMLTALQHGKLDTAQLTADATFYFTPETIEDYTTSLAPMGKVRMVRQTAEQLRGGMTFRQFDVEFASRILSLSTYSTPEGKLEQFIIGPGE